MKRQQFNLAVVEALRIQGQHGKLQSLSIVPLHYDGAPARLFARVHGDIDMHRLADDLARLAGIKIKG